MKMNKYNISKIVNGDLYNDLKYDNPKTFFERKFNKQLEALTIKYKKIQKLLNKKQYMIIEVERVSKRNSYYYSLIDLNKYRDNFLLHLYTDYGYKTEYCWKQCLQSCRFNVISFSINILSIEFSLEYFLAILKGKTEEDARKLISDNFTKYSNLNFKNKNRIYFFEDEDSAKLFMECNK